MQTPARHKPSCLTLVAILASFVFLGAGLIPRGQVEHYGSLGANSQPDNQAEHQGGFFRPRTSSGVIRGLTVQNGLVRNVDSGYVQSADMISSSLAAGTYGGASLMSQFTTDAAGRIQGFSTTPMAVLDNGGQVFNLMAPKYGIVANNSTDNSAGLQSWANDVCAANGTGYVPPIPFMIQFKTPIVFQPQNGAGLCNIRFEGHGCRHQGSNAIFNYTGTGAYAFAFIGCWHSVVQNVGLNIPGCTNMVGFDWQYTPSITDQACCMMEGCTIYCNNLTTNCIGIRNGQASNANSNGAEFTIRRCDFHDVINTNGNIFIQIGGTENYLTVIDNCTAALASQFIIDGNILTFLNGAISSSSSTTPITVFSTLLFPSSGTILIDAEQITYVGKSSTQLGTTSITRGANGTTAATHTNGSNVNQYVNGQGVYGGTGAIIVISGGSSGCLTDHLCASTTGYYLVFGGRYENGQRFFQYGYGYQSTQHAHIEVDGVYLAGYTEPADNNGCIWITGSSTFIGKNMDGYGNTSSFDQNFLTNNNGISGGYIRLDNCSFYGTWPLLNNSVGWNYDIVALQLTNSSGNIQGLTVNQSYRAPISLTDASTVNIDLSVGTIFILPMTSAIGSSRAITTRNGVVGQKFTVQFVQPASGGPCGVSPWFATIRWQGGSAPTFTSAASAIDEVDFEIRSSGNYLGTARLDY